MPAIRAESLSKVYRINRAAPDDLRSLLTQLVRGPLHRLRHGASHSVETEEFWALRDVSFELAAGEILGVIGRNGSGKSTLLKVLSQITEPTRGRAEIRGRVGCLLEVGTGFHPELTGRENVYLNGAILGMTRREVKRKFAEIVEFSGVERFLDTPVKRYSTGMRVRLGFAVAAHLEPEILIVDEVLSVGDAAFQKRCLGKMQGIAGSGRTVLFVSHNMAAVKSLCHRGILLVNGKVAEAGPTEQVVDAYLAEGREERQYRRGSIGGDAGWGDDFRLHYGSDGGMIVASCGSPLAFEFVIEAPSELREVSAGVTLYGDRGEPVVGMSSKVQKVPSRRGCSRFWRVRIDLGKIPLNSGIYHARVYLGDGIQDVARFQSAYLVEVEEHDVFGWGNRVPPPSSWGSMYWAPQWEIGPVASAGVELGNRSAEKGS